MNKGILIGGGIFIVAALAGAGVMNLATKEPAAPAGIADGAVERVANVTAASLAPEGVYGGTVTASGGYTGDVLEGDPDAPVTIIEYASLTCPHCASFHRNVYPALKRDYIDTGKAKFIYRDFPLNNPAIAASVIARCGGEDRYLAFIDLFLTQQERWTRAEDWMGELQQMAKLGGLGTDKINECLSDQALGQSVIDRYRAASEAHGVNSTPTLVIDGRTYDGDLNPAALGEYIDARM